MGECTEVGMYLAMSRQADREGYPEVAEAFKRYAWEEAELWDSIEIVSCEKTEELASGNIESGCVPRSFPYQS